MVEEIINLLEDPNFKIWVRSPNVTYDNYRNIAGKDIPEQKESIQKASLILKALDKEFKGNFPATETVNNMLRKILA